MKDGICNACRSTKIFAKQNGFTHGKGFQVQTGLASVLELTKTSTIDFVCVNCGYFEQYIDDKRKLKEVADSWEKVNLIDRNG